MEAILVSEFIPDPSILIPSSVPLPTAKPDQYLVRVTHCSPQHADILHAQGKHQNNNAKKGTLSENMSLCRVLITFLVIQAGAFRPSSSDTTLPES